MILTQMVPDVPDSRSVMREQRRQYAFSALLCPLKLSNVMDVPFNEFDLRTPVYTPNDIIRFGNRLKSARLIQPLSAYTPTSGTGIMSWTRRNPGTAYYYSKNKRLKLYAATDIMEKTTGLAETSPYQWWTGLWGEGDGWAKRGCGGIAF